MSFFAPIATYASSLLIAVTPIFVIGAFLSGCDGGEPEPGPGFVPPDDPDDGCDDCHTSPDTPTEYPFHLFGQPETVGAHNKHKDQTITTRINCDRCHPIPKERHHYNGVVDMYVKGNDWIDQFLVSDKSCTTYCHGPQNVSWIAKYDFGCATCHTETDPPHTVVDPNITNTSYCAGCHAETINDDGTFKSIEKHINRSVEMTCGDCHGNPPDKHLVGITNPTTITLVQDCERCHEFEGLGTSLHENGIVNLIGLEEGLCGKCHEERPTTGAHNKHIEPPNSQASDCTRCHQVPDGFPDTPVEDPSLEQDNSLLTHLRSPIVSFDAFVGTNHYGNPLTPVYDPATQGCNSVYCHNAGLWSGQNKTVFWNEAFNQTSYCSSCHDIPPETERPHQNEDCSDCHGPGYSQSTTDKPRHVDGIISGLGTQSIGDGCTSCHEKPPANHLSGVTDPADIAKIGNCDHCHTPVTSPFVSGTHRDGWIGFKQNLCDSCHSSSPTTWAHQSHIAPNLSNPFVCATCHTVPGAPANIPYNPPHTGNHPLLDHFTDAEIVNFGGGMAAGSVYTPSTMSCVTLCHGSELQDGQLINPLLWTDTSGNPKQCGACHYIPPNNPVHPPDDCSFCHSGYTSTTVNKPNHVNGQNDF